MDTREDTRLILSQIDKNFDPKRDIPLGIWCFSEAEDVDADWDLLSFPSVAFDFERFSAWYKKSEKLCEQFIIERGRQLNQAHDKNFNSMYWRELLQPWISTVVSASLGQYLYIKMVVELYCNKRMHVSIYSNLKKQWLVPETIDLFNASMRPEFNFWLSSLIVTELAPENWILEPDTRRTEDELPKRPSITNAPPQPIVKKFFRQWFGRMSFTDLPGVGLGSVFFSLFLNCLPARQNETPRLDDNPNYKSLFPEKFLTIVEKILDQTMPLSFGQEFFERDLAASKYNYKPGRLLISASSKFNEAQRFVNAKALQMGERIVRAQHGGSPGISLQNIGFWYDLGYHSYLSWGWTEGYSRSTGIHPLPSPMLSKFRNKHRRQNFRLIFVGTNMVPQLHIFRAAPQMTDLLEYRRDKARFISVLIPTIRQKLLYRPYERTNTGLEDANYLRRTYPNLNLLNENFHQELLKCKIVVHDHPGTTFLISMAANCPTIGYWNSKIWPVTDTANVQFSHLKEFKILHNEPQAAANYINENWSCISEWWASQEVQEARESFCRQFANTNKFWWVEWLRTVSQL